MSGIEIFQLWLMAFVTLALFSFMYKDNPFYRIARSEEHTSELQSH